MRKTGILAAALLVLGLAACGSEDDAFQGGSGAVNGSVATVTVITDSPTT